MKKRIIMILIVAVLLGGSLFLSPVAKAAKCEGVETALIECKDDESGVGHILSLVINVMSAGIGVLGTIGITVAGVQYLTAGDNEEQVRKAKRRIFEVVIGLAAYALIAVVLQWVIPGGMLNSGDLPHYETPEKPTGTGDGEPSGPSEPITKYAATFGLEKDNSSGFNYWINVPNNATSGMPLVVFLHGDGEMGLADEVKSLPTVQYMANASRSFIAIAPVGSDSDWSSVAKQRDLMALINKVVDKYNVDKNRIYLVGFSQGAVGTWDLVNSYPNYFAAAVPISGRSTRVSSTNFNHTKIYAIVGGAEQPPYVDYDYVGGMQRIVNAINSNGGSAKFEIYNGLGHSNMQRALRHDEIFNWLLKQ